jgi:hypothetical protein
MKNRPIFYIKYLSYAIAFLGFLSLLLNPRTQYLNLNHEVIRDYGRIFLFTAILISLFAITISDYFIEIKKYNLKNVLNISSVIYLLLMIYIINRFFYMFLFNQIVDFIIFTLHILPVAFILNDLLKPKSVKIKIFIPIGMFLIMGTILYFKYFYTSYEDYWSNTPIVIHYLFRDWLCLIGTILILISFLRIKIHER